MIDSNTFHFHISAMKQICAIILYISIFTVSEDVGDNNKSLANNPNPLVKGSVMSRLAMIYSIMNQTGA